jgi:hypothetical protein
VLDVLDDHLKEELKTEVAQEESSTLLNDVIITPGQESPLESSISLEAEEERKA